MLRPNEFLQLGPPLLPIFLVHQSEQHCLKALLYIDFLGSLVPNIGAVAGEREFPGAFVILLIIE